MMFLFGKKEQNAADIIGCEYSKPKKGLSSEKITELYEKALEKSQGTGTFPVIAVSGERLKEALLAGYEDAGGKEKYLRKMLDADTSGGEIFLKKRFEEEMSGCADDDEMREGIYGDFPEDLQPQKYFYSLSEDDLDDDEELLILNVPAEKPWQIFAHIPFGGWNDCPYDEDIMSVCRLWYEKYGALPAVIHSDIIQMYLPEPVTDREEAVKIAEQQFAFCGDCVYQGVGSINALAASVIGSNVWFFWWD